MSAAVAAIELATLFSPILRGQRLGAGSRWAILVHEPGRDLDGWSAPSSLPTTAQGTALRAGAWGEQAREQIAGFLRDDV